MNIQNNIEDHDCLSYIEDEFFIPYGQKFYVPSNHVMSPEEFDKKRRRVLAFKFFPKWYESEVVRIIIMGIVMAVVTIMYTLLSA